MDRLIKENKAICEPSLTCPTPWLKITSGEISVNQQEHVGNLAVIELLRRVLGRAAAPAEALDPRCLNRGTS